MSDRKEREKRREERIRAEAQASSGDRRKRILQFAAGLGFLVIAAVVVVIVVNSSSSDGGGDTQIEEAANVDRMLEGIPQNELVLGDPSAPVELIEFGDLQCPVCKANSEESLPGLIENKIATGEAKLVFRNFVIIGEESVPAGAAAVAAGEQGRGFNFIETFYRNQGEESSGYVTDEFLEAVAKAAGVEDLARWNEARESKAVLEEVEGTTAEAREKFDLEGTPSFLIRGPGTNGLEVLPNMQGASAFEGAIESAS